MMLEYNSPIFFLLLFLSMATRSLSDFYSNNTPAWIQLFSMLLTLVVFLFLILSILQLFVV